MGEPFTQTDTDNLADIIWWIKGYITGAKENYEKCPFCNDHSESLRKIRLYFQIIENNKMMPRETTK